MIIADAVVSGAVGLCSSGVIVAIVQGIFTRGSSHQQKEIENQRIWYQESHQHYETAKRETQDAKKECLDCKKELHATRMAVYQLLETLEDQIIPMLGMPGADLTLTRVAMREAVQATRRAI